MRQITIVGGGQAGLPLAIGLLKAGFRVRLVQNRTAADLANGKVLSSQCVFGTAREQERKLGLDLWADEAPAVTGMRIAVAAPDGSGNKAFGFVGNLAETAQSVDQRVKFPRFLDLFEQLGGDLDIAEAGIPELERYANDSDLVIVAAGKGAVSQLFARDAARSPYDKPMRALSLVYTKGTKPYDQTCVTATLIPGAGELFMIPALTTSGPCEILFFEAGPGGPLDAFEPSMDAEAQLAKIKALIRQFVFWEYERIADAVPTDANAGLIGRFPPTIRKGVGTLPSGKPVLGLADAVILNDPIVGQGSNNAMKAATIYLDAIVTRGNGAFDPDWMTATFETAFSRVEASTNWSNMILMPPPLHVVDLLARASGKQELADKVAQGFDEPATIVPLFADPALAAAAYSQSRTGDDSMSDIKLAPGITPAGKSSTPAVWNILGHTYYEKSNCATSFSFETFDPPGTFVPPHIHPTQDEFIYMLEGTFDLYLDGQWVKASAGDLVRMPMGLPHGYYNKTERPTRALFWVSPSRKLKELFELLHNMTDPEEVVRVSAAHEVDFLPPGSVPGA